ncbi:MAG: FixH family protein [Bacteroidia bacterium]
MNWGTKIVLGMIAFMLFIVGMVVYMFSVHGNDALIDNDYYEKGVNYDKEYKAAQNVFIDQAIPEITVTDNQIIIKLTDSASYDIRMMRPTTVKDDHNLKGNTLGDNNLILIDRKNMPLGVWLLELKWVANKKEYSFKKSIKL